MTIETEMQKEKLERDGGGGMWTQTVVHYWQNNTGCVKSSWPSLTRYNFDKDEPIFIIFHC